MKTGWCGIFGFLAFSLGFLFYLVFRSGDSVFFLSALDLNPSWNFTCRTSLSALNFLPSFFHTLAFSLFLMCVCVSGHKARMVSCGTWVIINTLFEIGQWGAKTAPALNILENHQNLLWTKYFIRGTFDPLDICGVFLGGICAFIIAAYPSKKGEICETDS